MKRKEREKEEIGGEERRTRSHTRPKTPSPTIFPLNPLWFPVSSSSFIVIAIIIIIIIAIIIINAIIIIISSLSGS